MLRDGLQYMALDQPSTSPSLVLIRSITTINTHVMKLCSNVHYLPVANCEGHDSTFLLLYRVNLAQRAGGAAQCEDCHTEDPTSWFRCGSRAGQFSTSRLKGWLGKETLPSHVICNSILRFALCHGCKQSVVPRRLPVMCKMWEAVTLPNFALWSEHVEGLGWYKLELRCSQLQVG